MLPVKTKHTNSNHILKGGTRENDLPTEIAKDSLQRPVILSVWVPSDEERKAIAEGSNIELVVWGDEHPPVAMHITNLKAVL